MIKQFLLLCFCIVPLIYSKPADDKKVEGNLVKEQEKGGKFGGGQGGRGFKKGEIGNFTIPKNQAIYACHKPEFLTKAKCLEADAAKPKVKIADVLMLDARKLGFSKDQWVNLAFMPTEQAVKDGKALKFKHAYVQLSDTSHQYLGRVAEQVPCVPNGFPNYKGSIESLLMNPGVENMEIYECPGTELFTASSITKNLPSVPVLNFKSPVEAFYVNLKFSLLEAEYMQDQNILDRLNIVAFLVDTDGGCHYFKISRVDGLDTANVAPKEFKVPLDCSSGPFALLDEERKISEKITMRPDDADSTFKNVIFPEDPKVAKLRTKERHAVIPNEEYRNKVREYNLKECKADYFGKGTTDKKVEEASLKDEAKQKDEVKAKPEGEKKKDGPKTK